MANEQQLEIFNEGAENWNSWREENPLVKPDLSNANLPNSELLYFDFSNANLTGVNFSDSSFVWVDFSNTDLSRANLSGSDLSAEVIFSGVNLSHTNLQGANLQSAFLKNCNLNSANLFEASLREINLSYSNLKDANLENSNLFCSDLTRANLTRAYMKGANLIRTNLLGANLSEANLHRVQALATNFEGANLTGACIEDWNINSQTNIQNVKCNYIYLNRSLTNRFKHSNRRPSSPNRNFEPGDFTKLVQKSIETVDLIFNNGIDWKAFLSSYQDIQVEYGEQNISIQAIEKKSDGAFVIRLNVPPDANKAEIESKARQSYETKLQIIEAQYRRQLEAKDDQIAIYRQHNVDLLDIIKLKASQPLTENHFHSPVGSVDNKGTQTNIAGEVEGNQNS